MSFDVRYSFLKLMEGMTSMLETLPTMENECFFIAPIGTDDSDIRKRSDGVLNFIVSRAVAEVGLTAVRADQLASPGQINLQVVDHVLNAKAAVADMTGLNPNVFYEIAIRHTARLPLVLIADVDCKLPFDISNMRTIFLTTRTWRVLTIAGQPL